MSLTIQKRRGTAAQWAAVNPVLADGEEGLETDTRKTKHGDGIRTWNTLPYFTGDLTVSDARFPRMTNLVSLGADPASATFGGADVDARPALDAVVLQAISNGMSVGWLPKGRYRLKTTYNPSDQSATHPSRVLPGNMRGFTWLGGWGKIEYTPTGGNKIYAAAEFVWYGDEGDVMWELDSIIGAAIIGVNLRGRGATNRAGIGLNISQRGAQVGSGLHLLDRVSFSDFAVAVKYGEGQTGGGGNCDTTTFRDCTWKNCDVAIQLTHIQNLVYNLDGTSGWNECPTLIRATAGGYFNINDLNANDCGGTGPDDWMLDIRGGRNIGVNKISRGRLEGDCKQLLKTRSQYAEVLIEGLIEAQLNQNVTMFDLTGGTVTMLGGRLVTHSADAPTFKLHQDSSSGGVPSVGLYRVRFDTARFLYEEWFTHDTNTFPAITVRDCEDQFGQRIPSFSTRLEDRLPVPLRAKTTDGTTNVFATLLNNGAALRFDNCCAISAGAYRIRATFIAVNSDTNALQVRATREFDATHTGVTLSISTPETIGTDYNPDSLTFSVVATNSYKHLSGQVRGKASTNLDWRVEFQLISGLSAATA